MKWDLDKALKNKVVLFSGEEYVLRGRALSELLKAASDGDDFDSETFIADASSPSDWLASAGTTPFLSPRRMVIVRNLARADCYKDFQPKNLPASALLLLVVDEEIGEFDRQKKFEQVRRGWESAVSSNDGAVFVFKTESKDLIAAIKEEAKMLDHKINDRAAETLRDMTGGSLSRALDELHKLALFSTGSQITENDVKCVVLASPEWSVYKMVDAITRGESGEVLRQLRVVIGANPKVEEVAFRSIIPTLTNQLRLLWQARMCVEAQIDPANIPDPMVSKFPSKPNIGSDADWKQRKALHLARGMSFQTLAKCFQAVSDCDARLKGQLASFNATESLERMTLEMIQAAKAR